MTNKHILLVEDEPTLLEIMKDVFEEHQLDVVTAENGQVALEKLKENSILMVVTDIKMPRLDGTELRRLADSLPTEMKPKFWVALTAHAPLDSPMSGLQDFNEAFYKPYSPNMLAIFCKKHLLQLLATS